jgi:hypothetical protein
LKFADARHKAWHDGLDCAFIAHRAGRHCQSMTQDEALALLRTGASIFLTGAARQR